MVEKKIVEKKEKIITEVKEKLAESQSTSSKIEITSKRIEAICSLE